MAKAEPRDLDWSSAQIEQGTLTVALSGHSSKKWSRRFEGILSVLDQGNSEWGSISVRKNEIEVSDVPEGSEADLHHLLESAVLQVNSALADDAADGEHDGDEPEEQDPRAAADHRMAERFRAFAEARPNV